MQWLNRMCCVCVYALPYLLYICWIIINMVVEHSCILFPIVFTCKLYFFLFYFFFFFLFSMFVRLFMCKNVMTTTDTTHPLLSAIFSLHILCAFYPFYYYFFFILKKACNSKYSDAMNKMRFLYIICACVDTIATLTPKYYILSFTLYRMCG